MRKRRRFAQKIQQAKKQRKLRHASETHCVAPMRRNSKRNYSPGSGTMNPPLGSSRKRRMKADVAQQPRAGTLNSVEESRPRLLVSHLTTNPIANKTVTAPRGLVLQTGPGRGVSSLPAKLLTSSHSHLKASGRQGGCGLGLAVCERWRANAFSPSRG